MKKDFISVKDKEYRNWSMYYKYVYILTINFFSYDSAGYITGWTLESTQEKYEGKNQTDFIETLNTIKQKLKLCVRNSKSRDLVVIYIDNVTKIQGFFKEFITDSFPLTVQLLDNFEFRTYESWVDLPIVENIQKIVDEIFIPEKYFYLTPNQRTRKLIAKSCPDNDLYLKVSPNTYRTYLDIKKALYGGICYCPYPNLVIPKPMLCLDIKSAYIYALLCKKFPMSKATEVDPKNYEFYLDNPYKTSLGYYHIKYSCTCNIVTCFDIPKDEAEVDIWLNAVDLKNFMDIPRMHVHSIKCHYLEEYDLDFIPDYVVERLKAEYLKKLEIDEDTNPILYGLQKIILNGIYGNTIKKANDVDEWKLQKKTVKLAPQWGIWTTSYVKQMILELGTKLTGWYYTDTDSIYCLDTEENRKIIEIYNEYIRNSVKARFTDERLYDLGKFDQKYEIAKFKAIKQKEYMFTTTSGKMIVKAAGCNKDEIKLDDSLYDLKQIPVGTRIFPKINEDYTECVINGVKYASNGSYWEKSCKDDEARFELFRIAFMNELK